MDYSNETLYTEQLLSSLNTLLSDKMMIVVIAALLGILVILGVFINTYLPLKKEIEYIKIEMESSFDEEEYLRWKRRLKRLYISKIPIVGPIINLINKR